MMGDGVWLVRGACFQVAHKDPQSLAWQWDKDPAFRAFQEAARATHLALISTIDTDRGVLTVAIGRLLAKITQGERACVVRDPYDGLSPAAETLRIHLRVFILASGYAADEDVGLVLLTPCSSREDVANTNGDIALVG